MSASRSSLGVAVAATLGIVLAAVYVPAGAIATHRIPVVLDTHPIDGQGGYVAWRIQVDPVDDRTDVYLHLGEHLESTANGANHTYLGLWIVNLDQRYVWLSVGATIESDGAGLSIQEEQVAGREASAAATRDWRGLNGGNLPFSEGEWLVVAFWATDGVLESKNTLGSAAPNGSPTVELVNKTTGEAVVAHDNGDFTGRLNGDARANVENTCPPRRCGLVSGAQLRVIRDVSVTQDIRHRLFGMFSVPGGDAEASWEGPTAKESGDQLYWFHGAAPGSYRFTIDRATDVRTEQEPVVAMLADVTIPGPQEATQ